MKTTTPEVHIYASARTFVVIPVASTPDGKPLEVTPGHTIPLTLGRPTVLRITRAIRDARRFSASEESAAAAQWDGDGGRWWQHHLISIAIKWEDAHVQVLESGESLPQYLPADTPEDELAERLIQLLGQKLHNG